MGADQSDAFHNESIVSAGYSSINDNNNFDQSIFDINRDYNLRKNELLRTPFHANWYLNNDSIRMPSPRQGIAYGYHQKTGKMFCAFGQKANNQYSSELIYLDVNSNKWTTIAQNIGQGRTNSSGIIAGDYFYVFGGKNNNNYFNDLYRINVFTNDFKIIKSVGSKPSPRCDAIMGYFEDYVVIWGGELDTEEKDYNIHIFNVKNNTWSSVHSDIEPRSAAGFTLMDNKVYIYGSSENEGMLSLDMQTLEIEVLPMNGAAPQTNVKNPALVKISSNYILCFGGESQYRYTHMYAYDTNRRWWFLFHIKPSNKDEDKGEITELGLFKIPRHHSFASIYDEKRRKVISVFGNLKEIYSSIEELDIAKALSICNIRDDLLSML